MRYAHDAQEGFAILSWAAEGVAEQRVEDLGRAAGVEEEEQKEGNVGAELSEEERRVRLGRIVPRQLGHLGSFVGRLLPEHLCDQLKPANHDHRADRLDE